VIFDVASERVANQATKPQTCGLITDSTPLPVARGSSSSTSSNETGYQLTPVDISALVILVFIGGVCVGILTMFILKSRFLSNDAKQERVTVELVETKRENIVKADTDHI